MNLNRKKNVVFAVESDDTSYKHSSQDEQPIRKKRKQGALSSKFKEMTNDHKRRFSEDIEHSESEDQDDLSSDSHLHDAQSLKVTKNPIN